MNAKLTFLNTIPLFSSNSTVSSVEAIQILRSIEFPLRFIRLDQLMITSCVYLELFLTVVVLI